MEDKRTIYKEERVWCPRTCSVEETIKISKCNNCVFFNGKENDKIKCLYNVGILFKRMHVTEFTCNGNIYKAKRIDDFPEEVISKITDDDYCSLCCFDTRLSNDVHVCLLRQSANSDNIDCFCCYDDEIWIQEKAEEDDK